MAKPDAVYVGGELGTDLVASFGGSLSFMGGGKEKMKVQVGSCSVDVPEECRLGAHM